eukprot:sb/3474562/
MPHSKELGKENLSPRNTIYALNRQTNNSIRISFSTNVAVEVVKESEEKLEEDEERKKKEKKEVIIRNFNNLNIKRKRERFELDQAQREEHVRAKERGATKRERRKLTEDHNLQRQEITDRYKFLFGLNNLEAHIGT